MKIWISGAMGHMGRAVAAQAAAAGVEIAGGVDVYRALGPKGGMMFPAAPGVILQKSPEEGKIIVDAARLAEVVLYD